ncbi:ABC transporter ATP-binding protein, partial [Chloroflexota bacterium]
GDSHVLQGLTLDVEEGTCVCLLGRNGMGKTTVIRTCMGITPHSAGEVRFKSECINCREPYKAVELGIGYVPEDRRPFNNLTVAQNLRVSARSKKDDAFWTIERVYEFFPQLKLRATHMGAALSGGEQQMLAIGRALMGNPDLILLDEPSQGLAPLLRKAVMEILKRIRETGVTILMSEQNLELAKDMGDAFYVINKGRVIYECQDKESLNDDKLNQYLAV